MTDAKKIDFWALYAKAAAEVEAEHAEKDANRGGVIAFYNRKGGVGSTTLAYHACLLARERGLSSAVASTDPTAELHRWLGLEPRAPDDEMAWDVDLAIVDVHAHTEQLPYDVDIWIVPVFNRMSFEHARDVSDQLVGEIYWLPNIQSALRERSWVLEVPKHLRGQVEILPAVPRSVAIASQADRRESVWANPETADTTAAHRLRATLTRILDEALTRDDGADESAAATG